MGILKRWTRVALAMVCGCALHGAATDAQVTKPAPTKIILDTDIGDDIDDAFALALALRSPEIQVIGITTAWGDTELRARLAQRLLKDAGAGGIPVYAGIATKSSASFSQARYAQGGEPFEKKGDAIDFLLQQAGAAPGEVTLVAIGPLTNIGAAITRDAAAFRKFKRVVLMGGSIRRGYGDLGYATDHGPQPEYNIYSDIPAAQKLFASGVPIFLMPLDSTQLQFDEVKRPVVFGRGSTLTNALAALYFEWVERNRTPTATLFDAMAVAYVADPSLCPAEPLHITVDERGMTRESPGAPNASACLASDSERFFRFLIPRLTTPHPRDNTTKQ